MGNSSPDATTKAASKSPVQAAASPPQKDTAVPKQDETLKAESSTNTEPLAPPPRPDPSGAVSQTPDYFSGAHDGSLTYETNPFEHSFASGGASASTRTGGDQTPGGTKLPSVAALTSPSGLLGSGTTPSFWGSLRSGPLSPAMLSGPQKDDYFSDGHHLRGGFPTPNESSLRSGLTPGGGGSMFPEPSPNSQALFNQLGGAATPGTIDFQRTALTAAAAQRKQIPHSQPNVTSQPTELANGMDVKPQVAGPFDQHDANDAANGLFLLAQAQTNRNGGQVAGQYAMAPQMPVHAHPQPMMQMSGQQPGQSPTMGDDSTGNGDRRVSGMSAQSDDNDPANRPNTRGKGKRPSGAQANQAAGRRKAEEPPAKAQAAKKAKANNGHAMEPEPPSEDEQDMSKEEEYNHPNGKKMTDEEKRKNFLERNRVAALKCRQRKKQWLANLQQKVEIFSTENDALSAQIQSLRDEVVNLKTLLLAHKDCPIAQQQGLQGMVQEHVMSGYGGQMNPYGIAAAMNNQQVMANQQAMQARRYS